MNPPPVSTLPPAGEKTVTKTLLWSLLCPGAGQIYLGQTGKGIAMGLVFIALSLILGTLTEIIRLPSLVVRVPVIILSVYICGDAFNILTRMKPGGPVGKWDFCSPNNGKRRELLPPDQQQSLKSAFWLMFICLFLGLTGPGILGQIALIAYIANH